MRNGMYFATVMISAAFAASLFTSKNATASQILAGPMVGHVTASSALVWLRAVEGTNVTAVATQLGVEVPGTFRNLPVRGFVQFHFGGLLPGHATHVVVRAKARDTKTQWEEHDLLFTTPSPPEPNGVLRIAFGSCSKDARLPYVPVFEAMAAEQPDLALFVGDNSYFIVGDGDWSTSGPIGDWNSDELMIDRHMQTRTNPYLQNLLRSIPSYAVWDDHDYGPNNSDREFAGKETALRVFKAVWANPGYGTPSTPGVFSRFRRGPADIFLMDDRYHKYASTPEHPDVPPEEAAIWGEGQLEWLCNELKRSTAPVKIIANGTQVISKNPRGEGHFNEAPQELAKLREFLREHEIGGVVFLSGDRHYTEVMRLEQDGAPDLIEFTSSPIQQGQAVAPLDREHETNVWAMNGNSYGLVTISVGEDGEGFVRFEMRDANNYVPSRGDEPAQSQFALETLQYE